MNIGEPRKILFKKYIKTLINEPLLDLSHESATPTVIEPIRRSILLPVYNVTSDISFLTSVSLRWY